MIKIRHGVFETNSSSTHSITMCMENDYDKFTKGELLLYEEEKLVTKEEAIANIKAEVLKYKHKELTDEQALEELEEGYGYQTYDQGCNSDLEGYTETFTTPSGEKIVAFGEYGYDG